MRNGKNKSEAEILRQKAEEALNTSASPGFTTTHQPINLSETETLKLIHELEVHQIELEFQNEELVLSRSVAQKSCEKYTALYDFAPSGYFTLSKKGEIIELNLCGANMLGKDRSHLITSRFGNFVSRDTKPTFNLFLEKVFCSNTRETCEVTLSTNNALPIFVHLTGIATENGEQCHLTMVDITGLKHAEEEILKLNEELDQRVKQRTSELEEANKELETFSYSVSHDLRVPLRHISGFIDLFLDNKSTQLTRDELRYLNVISSSASEMRRLIDAILSFSKLNRLEFRKTTIHSSAMVQQVIKSFEPDIKTRNITFNVESLPDVQGDEDLIRQVWTNLISNAIKYTGKKPEAVIDIGAISTDNETTFFIKDNGAGFDMNYSRKLFGVFQRLHKTSDFEGVGIGLANVDRIVKRHGGHCRAQGEPGKGATFYFSLPR
ncbi:MAG: ATP-binding protein [Bacteroidetes bacterium]|nr:ATP-binding protein [Bacteroidota bacterium]